MPRWGAQGSSSELPIRGERIIGPRSAGLYLNARQDLIPHTLVGPASNTRTVRRQSDMGYRQRAPSAVVGVLIRLEWFPTGRAKIPRLEES